MEIWIILTVTYLDTSEAPTATESTSNRTDDETLCTTFNPPMISTSRKRDRSRSPAEIPSLKFRCLDKDEDTWELASPSPSQATLPLTSATQTPETLHPPVQARVRVMVGGANVSLTPPPVTPTPPRRVTRASKRRNLID